MHADLDTPCTVIYCTADDLLPEARANARRKVTDAELVTVCVPRRSWASRPTAGSSPPRAGSWVTSLPGPVVAQGHEIAVVGEV